MEVSVSPGEEQRLSCNCMGGCQGLQICPGQVATDSLALYVGRRVLRRSGKNDYSMRLLVRGRMFARQGSRRKRAARRTDPSPSRRPRVVNERIGGTSDGLEGVGPDGRRADRHRGGLDLRVEACCMGSRDIGRDVHQKRVLVRGGKRSARATRKPRATSPVARVGATRPRKGLAQLFGRLAQHR
jgi:hypothetical protein